MPARGRLIKSLHEYTASCGTLDEFKLRLARVEVDESNALQNEDDEALVRAQSQVGVYKAKISNREQSLKKQLADSEGALSSGATELNSLVASESQRRRTILGARVCGVLGSSEQLHERGFLEDCFAYSKPLQAIEILRVYFVAQTG